jgi:succinate dehydrogenase / fumarate reductase, cytochrome b subunit
MYGVRMITTTLGTFCVSPNKVFCLRGLACWASISLIFLPQLSLGMSEQTQTTKSARPVYRNIHITQILRYRLPAAGVVSILHRVSGVLMFLMLPLVVWALDESLASEASHARLTEVFSAGAWGLPGWLFKCLVLALVWAYLHHFIAGVRHLWMDATHSVSRRFGTVSAQLTLLCSVLLTAALAWKLFF